VDLEQKRASTYNIPQNYQQTNGAKDALARVRLFDWIVGKVNTAL